MHSELSSYILHGQQLDCKLRFLLDEFSLDEMVQTLTALFSLYDHEAHWQATRFMRDLYLGSDLTDAEAASYIALLKERRIFEFLGSFLYSPNYSVRSATILALGKFSFPEYSPLIEHAAGSFYIYHDPLSYEESLFEIRWLTREIPSVLITKLFEHENVFFPLFANEHFESDDGLYNEWLFRSFSAGRLPVSVNDLLLKHGRDIVAIRDDLKLLFWNIVIVLKNLMHCNEKQFYTIEWFTLAARYLADHYDSISKGFEDHKNSDEHYRHLYERIMEGA